MPSKNREVRNAIALGIEAATTIDVFLAREPDLTDIDQAVTIYLESGENDEEGLSSFIYANLVVGVHSKIYVTDDDLDVLAEPVEEAVLAIDPANSPILGIRPAGFEYEGGDESSMYSILLRFTVIYKP